MKKSISFTLAVHSCNTEKKDVNSMWDVNCSLWCRGVKQSAASLQVSDGAKTVYFPSGDVMVRYLKDTHPELKTSLFVEDVTSNADKYLLSADMSAYKDFFIKEASDTFKKAYTNNDFHFNSTAMSVMAKNLFRLIPLSYISLKEDISVIVISCDQEGMYHAHKYSILCTSIRCECLLSGGDIGELNEFIFNIIKF